MRHPQLAEWSNYLRGLIPEPARQEMERHLASGCHPCRRREAMLRAVASLLAADASLPVPESATRIAEAIFARGRLAERPAPPRLFARPVYDSGRDPLPQGTRSGPTSGWQALYEAGPVALDLRVDHDRFHETVAVVGQLADRRSPLRDLSHLPVALLTNDELIAATLTNGVGEFHLEFPAAAAPVLRVEVEELGTLELGLGCWPNRRGSTDDPGSGEPSPDSDDR